MAVCSFKGCGGANASRCKRCGQSFCDGHLPSRSHGCSGFPEVCPKCGSGLLSEGYWESYEYAPISEDKVNWEVRNLWWLGALDFFAFPIPTEKIVKRHDGFYLRRTVGGKDIYCGKCGTGLKPFHCSRKDVHFCGPDDLVKDVSDRLVENDIGSMVVRDGGGRDLGLLTDSLILKAVSSGIDVGRLRVKDLNLEPLVTASWDVGLGEAFDLLRKSSRIALVDGSGKIAGILKEKNLKRFGKTVL